MTANNLFKQLIEKAEFRFIPVYNLRDNSVYGYKIIKDFDAVGFPNKEEVYDFAFDEGILEFFLVKLQERVYQAAEELGYLNCKLFHTIRVNYIGDAYYFSSAMDRLSSKFHLKKENIIFDADGGSCSIPCGMRSGQREKQQQYRFVENRDGSFFRPDRGGRDDPGLRFC